MITWFPKGAKSLHSQHFIKAYLALNPSLPLIADGGDAGGGALFDCSIIKKSQEESTQH